MDVKGLSKEIGRELAEMNEYNQIYILAILSSCSTATLTGDLVQVSYKYDKIKHTWSPHT